MTFEEWAESKGHEDGSIYYIRELKQAWDAATANVKKDHFMIGEEVEINGDSMFPKKGRINAISECGSIRTYVPSDVRRIPEWEPKDGEAVLARSQSGYAFYAVSAGGGKIYSLEGVITAWEIKPWKPDCQGLPWEYV